jgi:CubicO group peptidase (beta-lactamase class C family)
MRPVPEFKPDLSRVRDEMQALRDEYHLPGIGVGIVRGEEVLLAEGFGWADVVAATPYTDKVRHRIGSVTKTMVGLCVMALVDEGRLSLNDRVADLLPDIALKEHGESLTVWHLMTHTGGIGEAPNASDIREAFKKLFAETDPATPLAELYADGITIEVEPGTKWAYANHGFALLGEIVSRIEKERLTEVVRRRVFAPLGMGDSDLDDQPHPHLSHGYSRVESPQDKAYLDLIGVELESDVAVDGHNLPGKFVRVWGNGGAGAVQSTVLDMLTYASALLRGSRGIVRTETFAQMTADQWRPDRRLPGWGLSFSMRNPGGHRMFGHGGSVFGGWNSYLAMFPELDIGMVFHTNGWSDSYDSTFVPRALSAVLGLGDDPLPEIGIDPRVLETAPGVYELSDPGPLTNFRAQYVTGRVQLSAAEGGLVMHSRRGAWKDGVRLLPVRPGEPDFFAIDKPGAARQHIALLRDATGAVTGLRFQTICDMVRNPEMPAWT